MQAAEAKSLVKVMHWAAESPRLDAADLALAADGLGGAAGVPG